jgi:hypothetical protein
MKRKLEEEWKKIEEARQELTQLRQAEHARTMEAQTEQLRAEQQRLAAEEEQRRRREEAQREEEVEEQERLQRARRQMEDERRKLDRSLRHLDDDFLTMADLATSEMSPERTPTDDSAESSKPHTASIADVDGEAEPGVQCSAHEEQAEQELSQQCQQQLLHEPAVPGVEVESDSTEPSPTQAAGEREATPREEKEEEQTEPEQNRVTCQRSDEVTDSSDTQEEVTKESADHVTPRARKDEASVEGATSTSSGRFVAVREYVAVEEGELSLQPGYEVQHIDGGPDDQWWIGVLLHPASPDEASRPMGIFPSAAVVPV